LGRRMSMQDFHVSEQTSEANAAVGLSPNPSMRKRLFVCSSFSKPGLCIRVRSVVYNLALCFMVSWCAASVDLQPCPRRAPRLASLRHDVCLLRVFLLFRAWHLTATGNLRVGACAGQRFSRAGEVRQGLQGKGQAVQPDVCDQDDPQGERLGGHRSFRYAEKT